jgi:predicted secreted Zn-dependent protease
MSKTMNTNAHGKKFFSLTFIVYLALCLALPGVAIAEVREDLNYSYYEVRAVPGRLAPQINAASPLKEQGKIFHGYTNWKVRWTFSLQPGRGSCQITNVRVAIDAVITLPKLSNASAQQLAHFNRYMIALRAHELGHYKVSANAAQAIDHQLRSIPAVNKCDGLESYGNKAAHRLLNHYIELNRRYDRETNHGETQGARLNQ